MLCAMAVTTLRIDVDAECTDVNFAFIGCWRFVYCLKMLCKLILMLFAIAAETASIGCWLMPPALIFDWFMFQYWAGADPFVPFIAAYFNELFLLPLSPHPHVILHEGFTRSCRIHCFQKRQNLLPRRRKDFEDDHPTHPERAYFLGVWILRLRLRLRAEWQGWETYCSEWKSSDWRNQA